MLNKAPQQTPFPSNMNTISIITFLVEKRELAKHKSAAAKHGHRPTQLSQVKVIHTNLDLDTHGATAPNLEIKRHERQYLDAAP